MSSSVVNKKRTSSRKRQAKDLDPLSSELKVAKLEPSEKVARKLSKADKIHFYTEEEDVIDLKNLK